MLILIVAEGPDKGRIYEWPDSQTVVIGRESKQFKLTDTKASRQHARFKCEGGKWYVRDLASRHGTLINKIKIDGKTALADGDRVQIGRTHLIVARVPAEQAERAALLGGQPSTQDAWSSIPTYRRFIPRVSTAAAMTAAAVAIGCSAWLYMNTTDANLKLREDLLASQSGATKAQLAATEAQTQAIQSQLAIADRTDEIIDEVQTLGSSSTPVLNEILASVQSQSGNNEQLDEISLALADLHDTSQPTLDAILARVESQSAQWMTLAEVRDVMKRQQADTAVLLPELQAVALATRANEQSLDALRQQIEQAQARPDLDGEVLDQLEAVVAELQARPTVDQMATGVRQALTGEQQKTSEMLNRIEERLAKSNNPNTQDLIAPLREALTSQALATEQLVTQAFERQNHTTDQLAELKAMLQSQPDETATVMRDVISQIGDHGDLDSVLAAVKQIEIGTSDDEAMDLLRELAMKLESAPTSQQLADAVALAVTDQLDESRPLLERIASTLDSSAQQDEASQTLLDQVRLALMAQEETDARLDQIYDLLASSETSGTDNEALRQVLGEIRSKSIAGMDELRSTIRREIQAGLTEQRLAVAHNPGATSPIVQVPIVTELNTSPTQDPDTVTMAMPQEQDTIRVEEKTPDNIEVLSDVEHAYRLAFQTGKPITLGAGSIDAETGEVSKGRTLDPSAAMAAGITDWRDWYLMDDFAERMRLQQQAVKFHNGRRGKLNIIGIPNETAGSTGSRNTTRRDSGG
jgi:hypothetical protein